ncbi:tRNA (guanosine(37)-N1)-methyltransferase TrmD [Microgenomates group bacterium]|nr:tRNA (guanosine(37)-N1)-methyltransferase TrmD [Microgenomates group bacterium]
MQFNILSAVPEFFDTVLDKSILGRARKSGLVTFNILSLRDFAKGKEGGKKQVDDKPFGGGAGMILKIEPIDRALEYLEKKGEKGRVILTSAKGKIWNQKMAAEWAAKSEEEYKWVTIICGHYEGVDERVKELIDEEISIGQFVLTGGEVASLVMMDSATRLLEGVLGNKESLAEESHGRELGEVEYPQWTQPREYKGMGVPEILLSGDHGRIREWRRARHKN